MPKFKVTIVERIYANCVVEVEAADDEEAIQKGRDKAWAIPFKNWEQDHEIVDEVAEEIGGDTSANSCT